MIIFAALTQTLSQYDEPYFPVTILYESNDVIFCLLSFYFHRRAVRLLLLFVHFISQTALRFGLNIDGLWHFGIVFSEC